jgi:hypothetical protein
MNDSNPLFDLAAELVLYTNRNLFLTGKAGTGKTTFLRKVQSETAKKSAIVAPTGVAAINAGGVTMHSFFQLPFEPFIPVRGFAPENASVANRNNLFKKIRLSSVKREVMEELELLIIDEVSMLRSDQLDAIDTILKGVRRSNLPFGGVQVLFIGDMYQLPPVVNNSDWEILGEYYTSPFFFDAKVLKESELLYIELKKVYRQKEQHFIDLLNHVRNNAVTADDMALLNTRYQPNAQETGLEGYITITSHNYRADAINAQELKKLPGVPTTFSGILTGEFNDKNLPTEKELTLKPGAQVMFVKNDMGEYRRFYNGKLAVVKSIHDNEITVQMKDDGKELQLEKEEWKNIRYSFNKEKDSMEEEELGSFRQYPVRLAWAITIHKSQGLTFDKVLIDAGQSFAAGQVYVALSRCTTLEGMILLSRIQPATIAIDPHIAAFSDRENEETALKEIIAREKPVYLTSRLIKSFELNRVIKLLKEYPELLMEKDFPGHAEAFDMAQNMLAAAIESENIIARFRDQLRVMLASPDTDIAQMQDRVHKAALWLAAQYGKKILQPLHDHIQSLSTVKRIKGYLKDCASLQSQLLSFIIQLEKIEYNGVRLVGQDGVLQTFIPLDRHAVQVRSIREKKEKGKKAVKGETYLVTLQMFREGKSAEEIAALRNLTPGTIESHLAKLIGDGQILVTQVISDEKLHLILSAIQQKPNSTLVELKQQLSDDISFGEIRAVMSHVSLSEK